MLERVDAPAILQIDDRHDTEMVAADGVAPQAQQTSHDALRVPQHVVWPRLVQGYRQCAFVTSALNGRCDCSIVK